jgi:hypothetical protein
VPRRFDSGQECTTAVRLFFGGLTCFTALTLLIAAPCALGAAANDPSFDYLYIVSNEGGSSGGHTAIRFGRHVYHFQAEDGMLVLRRDRAHDFLYSYALLGNRTIHSTRVAVSKETRSSLLDRFRERHRAQEAQIAVRDALRNDLKLLEHLAEDAEHRARPRIAASLPIVGLGYFDQPLPTNDPVEEEHSTTILALRKAIVGTYGSDFLRTRRLDLARAIGALSAEDPTNWTVDAPSSVYAHPVFARSFSSRWFDLAAGLAALDVLDEAPALASGTHHAPDDAFFRLAPEEIRAFERYAGELSAQLVDLADSRRPDWGETLLVGMARLAALKRSVETGQLVFLDTFPDEARRLEEDEIGRHGEVAAMMLLENRRQLERSRGYFAANADAGELAWERVEERANRYLELRTATLGEVPMRVARGHLVPSRTAPYPVRIPIRIPARRISAPSREDITRARKRDRAYSKALRRLHRYNLISQNCATALFETINDSFAGSVEISQRELGGHVPSQRSLAFIPFVSAQRVNERYTIVSREIIPSYRQLRLEEMKDRESAIHVALRESNTFTSTTYKRSSADSFFVFFTDQSPLLRPLFGVVNLTAAIGQSVLGIFTAPIDRGAHLRRGLRGAFVSLPELAFANIRKGSNDWIPKEHRSLDPIVAETGQSH